MKTTLKFYFLIALTFLFTSCSEDEDTTPDRKIEDVTIVTSDIPEALIESNGSVTVRVSASFENDNEDLVAERGFVYDESEDPRVESGSLSTEASGSPANATGQIRGLKQGTLYFIRGFLRDEDGTYFYGEPISYTTPSSSEVIRTISMAIEAPGDETTTARSADIAINIEEILGVAPVEVGVQFSQTSDFATVETVKAEATNFTTGRVTVSILFLSPAQTYFVRPFATYDDESTENGGSSVQEITTKELSIGAFYPIFESEFEDGQESSQFVVMGVDTEKRTAKLVLTKDQQALKGWTEIQEVAGLEIRNPSIEEIKSIVKAREDNDTFGDRVDELIDLSVWTNEEDGADKAFVYNPVKEEKTSISKLDSKQFERSIIELKY